MSRPVNTYPGGTRLRILRERSKLTAKAAAALVGHTPQYWSDLEHGRREFTPQWALYAALKLDWRPSELHPELAWTDELTITRQGSPDR